MSIVYSVFFALLTMLCIPCLVLGDTTLLFIAICQKVKFLKCWTCLSKWQVWIMESHRLNPRILQFL